MRGNSCETGTVLYCRIARLRPGSSITSTIRTRMTRPGITNNTAVVYTDSPERADRRNAVAARVRVGRVPPICVTGLIRAAC